jgi:hypothetical protein
MQKTPRYLLTKKVRNFLKNENNPSLLQGKERIEIIRFLKHNLIEVFNYPFALKYLYRKVKIYKDSANNLDFIITEDNHRLYFKKGMSRKKISSLYNGLCMEQDDLSPHNYKFNELKIHSDTILADVGAAEGIFSLSVVDKIKQLYLFECDASWIEALEATFAPWKEKIQIVNKYISDENNTDTISLDQYFAGKEKPTLLKIDVEGVELKVLQGGNALIDSDIQDMLICTYHRHGDADMLSQYVEKKRYYVKFSLGYMLFLYEEGGFDMEPPYDFRKGLIHASR